MEPLESVPGISIRKELEETTESQTVSGELAPEISETQIDVSKKKILKKRKPSKADVIETPLEETLVDVETKKTESADKEIIPETEMIEPEEESSEDVKIEMFEETKPDEEVEITKKKIIKKLKKPKTEEQESETTIPMEITTEIEQTKSQIDMESEVVVTEHGTQESTETTDKVEFSTVSESERTPQDLPTQGLFLFSFCINFLTLFLFRTRATIRKCSRNCNEERT